MRQVLERDLKGERIYVFTNEGHVYVGVFKQLLDDVVELRALDGRTRIHVNLTDVSGVRLYDVGGEEDDD